SVALLIKAGAAINFQSAHTKETALHASSRNGHELVTKLLLKVGGDPNLPNFAGNLPLHLAAIGGHVELVADLARFTQNLNQKDKQYMTPLHYAIMQGHYKARKSA